MKYTTKKNYNASWHDAKLNPWTSVSNFLLSATVTSPSKIGSILLSLQVILESQPRSLTESTAIRAAGWQVPMKNQICHRTVQPFYYCLGPSY